MDINWKKIIILYIMSENFVEFHKRTKKHTHDDDDTESGSDSGSDDSDYDSEDDYQLSKSKYKSGYMNSAMYLIFCIFCILIGWWLCAKGIIKSPGKKAAEL